MVANVLYLVQKPVEERFYHENNTLPSFSEALHSFEHMGFNQPARRADSSQLFDYMPGFVRFSTSSRHNVFSPSSSNYLYEQASGYEHTEKFHFSVSLKDYLNGKAYGAIKNSIEKKKLDVFFKIRIPPTSSKNLDTLKKMSDQCKNEGIDWNPYELLPGLIYEGSEKERVVKNIQFTFYWKLGQKQEDFIKTMSKIDTALRDASIEPEPCASSDVKVTEYLSFRDENESRFYPNIAKMERNAVLINMKKEIAERDRAANAAAL